MPIPKLTTRDSRVYGEVTPSPRQRSPRSPSRRPFFRKALSGLVFLVAAGAIVLTGVVVWVSKDLPDPNKLSDRQVAQSTKIYDRTGAHLLYEIYQNQKRTIVNLEDISTSVPKAFIAIEDKHFYEHSGVRIVSIIRAGINNLIGRRSGGGGASTLTQQLVKNTIVGNNRSLFRKLKEAILAVRLEKKYSKEEILKLYLNEIPLGSTNYGVEAAAESYFRKSAKDLTLAEAATLAAMNQAPSRYLNNINALRGRRDLVLQLMQDQGYVSDEQRKEAQGTALRMYRSAGIFAAPHFVLYVKQLLADQFGEKLVDTGGLKVVTSLDYEKQMLAERVVKEQGDKFAKSANANNAALVAIDPKTAQILAMVGSRSFDDEAIDGQFNVAVLGKRQPGSSFKPFVYLAAFEKGYTPDTVLYDVTTDFDARDGETYSPKNYDSKEHGLVTMRGALQNSLNIPSVKTLYLVGVDSAITFAKRFGYTTFTGDYGLSLVLGGGEVNLLEHANAYATLADNGVYHQPVSVLKVMNDKGETLSEWQQNEGAEAVKPELAALLSSVLSNNQARAMIFGLNNNLVLPDRPVAAKTGTTNDSKDAWTLGYTPSLAVGVWVGNTIPATMKGGGNLLAGVIWNQFMRQATSSTSPERFPDPPANDATKPVLTGSDGGIKLRINTATGKIAASTTPENMVVEKTYLPPHDILYYVQKDDPRGPAPVNPNDDPQFQTWEAALQDWVVREQEAGHEVTLQEPPTDYDSPQALELSPTVEILLPSVNARLTSRAVHFEAKASAPRGVTRVTFFIDSVEVARAASYPFVADYMAQGVAPGPHLLKAVAQDDMGNSAFKEQPFTLDVAPEPATFEWTDGSPLTLTATDFPRAVALKPSRWDATVSILVYLQSASGEKKIFTFIPKEDTPVDGKLSFTWKRSPGVGDHTLRAVLMDREGRTVEKNLEVSVK
ncbi:MAG: PBP1A family penicillin-binding protein [Candidatus Magasanikbacteria bacterium]|nr:PBP1A family penicillin-binding protein [Candidatus Magasanikbacteria bacterium]